MDLMVILYGLQKILCLDSWFKTLTNENKYLEWQDNQIKIYQPITAFSSQFVWASHIQHGLAFAPYSHWCLLNLDYMHRTGASLLVISYCPTLWLGEFIMSSGKNASCLEMAFALNMVNHGQTMVMSEALLELHLLTLVLFIKLKSQEKAWKRQSE